MQLEGVVKRVNAKPYKGRKSGTVYSFLLIADNGEENWITFGFDKEPPFEEGDRVAVTAERDKNNYLVYVEGTGRIIPPKSVGQGISGSGQQGGSGVSTSSVPTQSAVSTPREQADKARQAQIVWQHSQEMAIAKIGLLLQHDGLPMSIAKTKAAQAQRYEEISAMIDKETVKAYNDVVTGRVLEHVADIGVVDNSAKDGIPPAEPKKAEQKATGDEY